MNEGTAANIFDLVCESLVQFIPKNEFFQKLNFQILIYLSLDF